MKKFWSLVSLLLIGTMILSACASPSTQAPADNAVVVEPTAAAPTSVPPTPEPPTAIPPTAVPTATEIPPSPTPQATLTMWFSTDYQAGWEAILPMFEQQYGVKVNVQYGGALDYTKLQSAFPTGDGPDLAEFASDATGILVQGGMLAPIDFGEKIDQFMPGAILGSSYLGKVYGFPVEASNIALFWNTEILDKAPTTWDEFEQTCEKVLAAGVEHCLLLQQGDPFHFQPILSSFGGYGFGYNPDGTANPLDVGLDSPGSLAAATWLDKMVKVGYIKGGVTWENAATLFGSGKGAMYITGSWNLQTIRDSKVPYAIAPVPSGIRPSAPFLGIRVIGINSFSKNQALAEAFLTEFLATEEAQLAFFNARNTPIAFLPALAKITDPDTLGMSAAGMNAFPAPTIPEMGLYWKPGIDALTFIMDQSMDPTTAFKSAAEQLRTLIAEQKK